MRFFFDKPASQNIRKSLRKEWIDTNALGGYASSSLIMCNTRKYHGLLVANLHGDSGAAVGRHVLLSCLDECLQLGERQFNFSCRNHPGVYHPRGHEYLHGVELGEWPRFKYRFGGLYLSRELMLVAGKNQLLIRYTLDDASEDLFPQAEAREVMPRSTLRLRPLLAFRSFHGLSTANLELQVQTTPVVGGFKVKPYADLPTLYMQTSSTYDFFASPDWYYNVEYQVERERGFPSQEDLFQPGLMDIELKPKGSVLVSFSLDAEPLDANPQCLEELWQAEVKTRTTRNPEIASKVPSRLMQQLIKDGGRFLINTPKPAILAGYHWFEAWGRDSLIALPGLTFFAGREAEGLELLKTIGASVKDGVIPNFFNPDGINHAYNSVDASLWYVWAVQQLLVANPQQAEFVKLHCWPVLKQIVFAYTQGRVPKISIDAGGLIHVGDAETQLTWMDANAYGHPVTPRYGCPVEINALWYNALAFTDYLARQYHESTWYCSDRLNLMRASFIKEFYVRGVPGYLADTWSPELGQDTAIRPNMIFAVSLPYTILEDDRLACVVETVRNNLLTPYGLRTLSPKHEAYRGIYEGGPDERDSAYHQGTVWPWLLGAYGDALLKVAWDVDGAVESLLETITPLYTTHLQEAGVGSISEIFSGNPPYLPDGSIAQAWSVAECLRLLMRLKQAAPAVFLKWEAGLGGKGKHMNQALRG